MAVEITKASGNIETFDTEKMKRSLMRSGASEEVAAIIVDRVLEDIEPLANTRKIYRLAKKYLRRYNHASGLRYSLKKAIMRLGPTGYPFEKYFGEILKEYGYETEIGRIIEGKCVKHEVDVIAFKDSEVSVSECKYHNSPGKATDVKTAMYVRSRFDDLKPPFQREYPDHTFSGSLVTNTRCTSDAIEYAKCSGFRIVSWGYPSEGNLQRMIEDKRLYPVTILTGIQKDSIKRLFDEDIILLKDIIEIDVPEIQSMLTIPKNKAELLKKQADKLCFC